MKYPPYTIMQRRYYYESTLGVERGWHPVPDVHLPFHHLTRYIPDLGRNAFVAPGPRRAHTIIRDLNKGTYHLSHGEYSPPSYGYVQPAGKIRLVS